MTQDEKEVARKSSLDTLIEELDESTDVKQCEKMKRYKDNIQAMYGKDPYRS